MVMRQRQLDRIAYAANSISTIDLPREHWDKKILLQLVGDSTTGIGTPARTSYNPFDVITRIEVIANGSQTIKSISGKMLYLQNILEHGTVPNRTQTPSSASQSGQAFGGGLMLYFDKDKDYLESLLPTHVLSSLQLKVTWGNALSIDTQSTNGLTINSLYIYPLLTEEINVGQSTAKIGVLKETEYVKTLTAAGWVDVDLPVGNVYESINILARNNSVADNTIVSEYEVVKDGLEIIRKARFDQSRAEDLIDYAIEAANQPTGFTIIDFDLGGSAPINTRGWSSLKLRLNVSTTPTSTSDVTIVSGEIILPLK
jgi:hypothetical protein